MPELIRTGAGDQLLRRDVVSQACLPHLRKQGSGRVIQISTVGAVGTMPLFGLYNASKWALEGFSSALAEEVAPFGIHVTMAQLGGFETDWATRGMRYATANPAYDEVRQAVLGSTEYPTPAQIEEHLAGAATEPEEPSEWADEPASAAAEAIMALADDPRPPRRQIIGSSAREIVRIALERRRDDYRQDPAFTWPR